MRYIKSFGRKVASAGVNYAAGRIGRSIAARAMSGIGAAAQAAKFNLYGKYKLRKKYLAMGGALTDQKNVSVVSNRGRVPRRWRKFVKKVNMAQQSLEPRGVYTSTNAGSTTGVVGEQQWAGFHFADTNTSAIGDIWNCFKDAYSLAAIADAQGYKLYVKNVYSNIMISTFSGGNGESIDLYLCVARDDSDDVAAPASQLSTYWGQMLAVGTTSINNLALDVFQVANFVRNWKVLKTYKFVIDNGKTIRAEHSFPVRRYITGNDINEKNIIKGLTHMWLYRVRGAPNGTALGAVSSRYFGTTRINYQISSGLTRDIKGQSK